MNITALAINNLNLIFLSLLSIHSENVAKSITHGIDEIFVKSNIHFDIILVGSYSNNLNQIMKQIQVRNKMTFAYEVKKINKFTDLKRSAVILMTEPIHLSLMNAINVYDNNTSLHPKFLLYSEQLNENNIESVTFNMMSDFNLNY